MIHVVRYESRQDWAEHVAARLASFLADEPAARIALPTGATPEPVYAGMVDAVRAGVASFRSAHVFLLDEFGGVPPDAKGRCDVMLHRSLLDHVDLAPQRYHRLDPEAEDLAAMCAATRTPYLKVTSAAELDQALASPNGGIEVVEAVVRRDDRRALDARIRALADST